MMAKRKTEKTVPKVAPPNKTAASNKIAKPIAQVPKAQFSLNMKLAILLAIISFIVYANSLQNGFVYDDYGAIKRKYNS